MRIFRLSDETIVGDDGSNDIFGGGGDDTLIGNNGADNVTPGSGNDVVYGEHGEDFLRAAKPGLLRSSVEQNRIDSTAVSAMIS